MVGVHRSKRGRLDVSGSEIGFLAQAHLTASEEIDGC